MKNNLETVDMMAELFIDKQQVGVTEYWIPPLSVEEYLNKARATSNLEEKTEALRSIILHYRSKHMDKNGCYIELLRKELVGILESFVDFPLFKTTVAEFLLREGAYCEKARDFESGVVFYGACAALSVEDPMIKFFSLNNLGFCFNYVRKFDEAEKVLRQAIAFDPNKYNAWKNLGVSLEWQGQYEEAVECFIKAITISKGEPRSRLHLNRLLERHPTLKKLPCFA
ncbi:MAG: tetratricopeptide repeat protein [Candidatus Omnitrophota bacterium]